MRRLCLSFVPWVGSFILVAAMFAVLSPYFAAPALALSPVYGSQTDAISYAKSGGGDRDFTIEGMVTTVWDHTFLLKDGSGEVVVDVAPHTSSELGLSGGMSVQVVGKMSGALFAPMIISSSSGVIASYTEHDNLPELSEDDVRRNTVNHRVITNQLRNEIENINAPKKTQE